MKRTRRRGFTLVELLVVIAIVLLVSLVAMPVVYSSMNGRQVVDGARIFTGGLVGLRDSAIRYNQPRGMRLLPDPVLTIPAPGLPGAGSLQLCYNRMIPIEPAGDYSAGKLTIGPQYYSGGTPDATTFPPVYWTSDQLAHQFPFVESPGISKVLMVEESPFVGGFASALGQPNSPTNWYWTVRVGDKIKIHGTGRAYTIVGPCVVNPNASVASGNRGNPEMFVNVGAPGTPSPLVRAYYPPPATVATPAALKPRTTGRPEFLFLVNGVNDDDVGYGHRGYTDEGFDGRNNNPYPPPEPPPGFPPEYSDTIIDDPSEWEEERWTDGTVTTTLHDKPTLTPDGSPSAEWVFAYTQSAAMDLEYTIKRRPVPSQGAREISLPAGIVIDATTWNSTRERSRIPVEPGSLYCDIMVHPGGQYVPTTLYSTPAGADPLPFLHFWLTSRADVHPRGSVWGMTGANPNHNPNDPDKSAMAPHVYHELPMSNDALGVSGGVIASPTSPGQYYPAASGGPVLESDRRLVTMFARTGLITTNTIESIAPVPGIMVSGEGFHVGDVNYPFLKAQQGQRDAR